MCIEERSSTSAISKEVETLEACIKPRKGANVKTIIHGLTLVSLILLTACMAGAAQSPSRWELLGQREVDFKNDRDQIDVGRSEGRFKQLEVRVKNAPVEISDMVVTFENDTTFKPKLRYKELTRAWHAKRWGVGKASSKRSTAQRMLKPVQNVQVVTG